MFNRTILLILFFQFAHHVFTYKELPISSITKLTGYIQPNRLSVDSELMKPLMIKRVSGTFGNEVVRNFIINHFLRLGWDVKLDHFIDNSTPIGQKTFTNIIATLDPESTSHLVLAAHFDSMLETDFDFIGASDSAVSCGILMHLAEILTDLIKRDKIEFTLPHKSIQIIFFDGEEAFVEWGPNDSIYGARHLAKTWGSSLNKLNQIDVLVLLDLLGTTKSTIPSYYRDTNDLFYKMMNIEKTLNSYKLLNTISQNTGERLAPLFDPISAATFMGEYMEDDHVPFLERGVKILHMIPWPFPSVWHSKHDTPENIDQSVTENLAAIILCFTSEYLELKVF